MCFFLRGLFSVNSMTGQARYAVCNVFSILFVVFWFLPANVWLTMVMLLVMLLVMVMVMVMVMGDGGGGGVEVGPGLPWHVFGVMI